jgi:hypothetical protein
LMVVSSASRATPSSSYGSEGKVELISGDVVGVGSAAG